MSRRSYQLIAVMAAALLVSAAILIGWPNGIVRAMGALTLGLLLPGYSLSILLAPRLQSGWQERLPLSIGLSMAAIVLGGLILNLMPWGIGTQGWIAWLGGLTLAGGAIALARQRATQETEVTSTSSSTPARDMARFAFAIAVAVLAVAVAGWGAVQQSEANSTQLWLLSSERANAKEIQFGIRSLEASARSYRLQLVSSGQVLGEWSSVTLAPGERWEGALALPPVGSPSETIEALLFDAESDTLYRRAVLRQVSQESKRSP